jgi:hypothetical protein
MWEEINHDRRRFFSTAAMTVAAATELTLTPKATARLPNSGCIS